MRELSSHETRSMPFESHPTSIHFDVFTLFPEMFHGPLEASILKRAEEGGNLSVVLHDIRDYATDKHHVTDEPPYGGGGGMVMKAEPVFNAVETVLGGSESGRDVGATGVPVILLTPQGRLFSGDCRGAVRSATDRSDLWPI